MGLFSYEIANHPGLGTVILLKYGAGAKEDSLEIGVAPGFGSNMFRFRVRNLDLIYCDIPALTKHDYTGNFVLWPFPNRIRERTWRWRGKTYSLEPVRTPRGDAPLVHGLVRDSVWTFEAPAISDRAVSVATSVVISPEHPYFKCYPFPSKLTLRYALTVDGVYIDYQVINLGDTVMPFGFALHPLFSTLLSGKDATLINLPAEYVMEAGEDLLPTGKLLKTSSIMYCMFDLAEPHAAGNLRLDHVYTGLPDKRSVGIDHASQKIRLHLTASCDFTHCVIFTMEHDKFVCVEHQTCSVDAPNLYERGYIDEAHLLVLAAGESHSGCMEYRIEDYGKESVQ